MDKSKLVRFIEKYYLDKEVQSVILETKSDILFTRFITGDKSLLGELTMSKWKFENSEIGVYNTEQFLKLLDVLDADVNLTLTRVGDKSVALRVSDKLSSVNYMLSSLSVINRPPEMKRLPSNFELKINVGREFIHKFVTGKSALPETDTFTVLTDNGNTKVVIGYSAVNTNRVILPVNTSVDSDMNAISFNANFFSKVLVANKECESAELQISSEGLAKINFKVDEYDVTYYLVEQLLQ